MPGHPATPSAELSAAARTGSARWPFAFIAIAGGLGAAGVTVAAAGAHLTGGGNVTGGENARTAAEFLMIHAAALLGAAAVALSQRRVSVVLVTAMGLISVGAALFGGEVAVSALADWRPLPLAAPTGGLCLIVGWMLLALAGVLAGARSSVRQAVADTRQP